MLSGSGGSAGRIVVADDGTGAAEVSPLLIAKQTRC
jgi:hypothetical protein